MKVAHWVTVSRSTLDFDRDGYAAALAVWEDVAAGLHRTCADEGVEPPTTVDCRIEWDTDIARAARQASADAQADAEGVERWTVSEIVTFHMEGDTEPLGAAVSAMFGTGVDPDDGTPCGACDGTGHVCSDDGTATAPPGHHGDQLHPWDGLSHRADACDHGGGEPCPVCMIPPGQRPYLAPDVVDAPLETRSPSVAHLDLDPAQLGRGGRLLDHPYARPDLAPVTPLLTGLDRVRDAGYRMVADPRIPPRTWLLIDSRVGGGLISEPDARPWWRRTLDRAGRLLSTVRGASRR